MQEKASQKDLSRKLVAFVLLIIPWIAYLWISSYDKAEPTLFGVTYFYWYQTVWLAISSILYVVAALLIYRGDEN